MKATKLNVSIMSSKAEAAFISTGYSNCRKATVQFKEHELSLAHRDAINAHKSSQSTSVSSLLASEMKRNQEQRRIALSNKSQLYKALLRQALLIGYTVCIFTSNKVCPLNGKPPELTLGSFIQSE